MHSWGSRGTQDPLYTPRTLGVGAPGQNLYFNFILNLNYNVPQLLQWVIMLLDPWSVTIIPQIGPNHVKKQLQQ